MILAQITALIGVLTIIALITLNMIDERARTKKTELAFKYARRNGLSASLKLDYSSRCELINVCNGYKTMEYSGYESLLLIIRRIKHDFIEQNN